MFVQSYLKGMALEWFEPNLLNSTAYNCPVWMDDYETFIHELKSNFSPHDLVTDAEHQLDHLTMKDGQHINKYVVEFNHLARQVCSYGQGSLCHIFYNGLPDRIKHQKKMVFAINSFIYAKCAICNY